MAGFGVPGIPKLERTISHQRTSALALLQLRCQERDIGDRGGAPVKLVVFDLDETLTLATFLPRGHVFPPEQRDTITTYNFRTPFVDEGDRVDKLKTLLAKLTTTIDGQRRGLAILSMNQAGVKPIVQLLKAADLDVFFDAIWGMPWNTVRQNGAFRKDDGEWDYFDPPLNEVANHKADILNHLTKNPSRFFPQLNSDAPTRLDYIRTLSMEELVLVDDQRANFQNDRGIRIPRYAKVARYDAQYRGMGNIHDMGGVGAHSDIDFENLSRFVNFPSECPETHEARCGWERQCGGMDLSRPIRLVVFGFDETLTLATFMPDDKDCKTDVDWKLDQKKEEDWTEESLVKMNFETPFVRDAGSRVDKLREMCRSLVEPAAGQQVRLAVLTKNEAGAVATLNLLRLAGLAEFFDAVWRVDASAPNSGAFQEAGGVWRAFTAPASKSFEGLWDVTLAEPPRKYTMELRDESAGAETFAGKGVFTQQGGADKDEEFEVQGAAAADDRVQVTIDFADAGRVEIEGERKEFGMLIEGTVIRGVGEGSKWTAVRKEPDRKADVLHEIVRRPAAWFPQLASGAAADGLQALQDLQIEDVLLVDDERIIHGRGGAGVLRYCKVARYDDDSFWDCGFQSELGGLGAKSDKDYSKLESFVRKSHLHLPTDTNPEKPDMEDDGALSGGASSGLQRSVEEDGRWPKTPRQRSLSHSKDDLAPGSPSDIPDAA